MPDNFPAIIFLIFLAIILWKHVIRPFFHDKKGNKLSFSRETRFSFEEFDRCRNFLLNHHTSYYRELRPNDQDKFVARTIMIMNEKMFIAEEGMTIDYDHKIILASTLAQLTFGLLSPEFMLPKFQCIHIFPHTFYSKLLNHQVKGLTLGNGRIFLSWDDLRKGYENGSDKVNLGLHEFVHALEIELKTTGDEDFNQWQYHANKVMFEFQEGRFGSFRSYASTNIHELWATTVETFFEAPHAFKRDHPQLYAATVRVLNQDPTMNTLRSV